VGAPYWLRLVRPAQQMLTVAVRSWRETVGTDSMLLRYARVVAIPTAGARRQSSAVHKEETQKVSNG
jgi:hypothetical protein